MGVIEARRRILMSAPHPVTTTQASVASFQTDMVGKLKSAKFGFLPVQSGSGDPSPTNIRPISGWDGLTVTRCGKNLFNPSDAITGGYFNRSGGINENASFSHAYIKVNPGDTVVYSGLKGANGNPCGIQFFDASKNFLSSPSTNDAQANGNTVTIPAGASYVGISVYNQGNATYSDMDTAQLELGSTATAYAPYTGTTISVTFGAVNKNLFPNADGSTASISISAGTQITISAKVESMPYAKFTYADGTGSGLIWMSSPDAKGISTKTFTPEKDVVEVLVYVAGGIEACQVELGSTATPYVPYGTIYGGYVDVVRGEVVAEWASVDLGTLDWAYYDTVGQYGFFVTNAVSTLPNKTGWDGICTAYKALNTYVSNMSDYSMSCYYDDLRIRIVDSRFTDAATFKAAMSGVMLAYKLATPIHYALTPQIIKSLRGANNMWSTANGDTQVTYWTH